MKAETRCKRAGRKAGKSRASWFYDWGRRGLTDMPALEKFLDSLANDVDPEVLDRLPFLDLSGQHADGPNDASVLDDCGYSDSERMLEREPERCNELIAWYREAYDEAVVHEVLREGRDYVKAFRRNQARDARRERMRRINAERAGVA